MLERLRHEVWRLHLELPKNNLVDGGKPQRPRPRDGLGGHQAEWRAL